MLPPYAPVPLRVVLSRPCSPHGWRSRPLLFVRPYRAREMQLFQCPRQIFRHRPSLLVSCFEAGRPGLLLKVDPGCVTIGKRSLLIEKGGRHQYISALQFAGGGAASGLCTGCADAPLRTAGRWSAGCGSRARSSHRGAWSIWERRGLRAEGRYRPPAGSLPGGADRLTDRHVVTGEHRYEDRTTPVRRAPRGSL